MSVVTEPATGVLLFITGFRMWEFDPIGDGSWRKPSVSIPSVFAEAGSTAESLIAVVPPKASGAPRNVIAQ